MLGFVLLLRGNDIARGALFLSMGIVVLAIGGAADAQPNPDSVSAQNLFDEGKALMKERHYPEACAKFESSQRIDPKPGTALNLAHCFEKSGQTASAWARYVETAELAALSNQHAREMYARGRAEFLAPRLARITIHARGLPPDALVQWDGVAVNATTFDTAVPIDPGEHTVEVIAAGAAWSKSVNVAPGKAVEVTIPLPLPRKIDDAITAPAVIKEPEPRSRTVPPLLIARGPEPKPRPSSSAQKALAVVAAGVGTVGLATGAYFALIARPKWSDAMSRCTSAGCPMESVQQVEDAQTDATIATISFITGGVMLAGAAALWFTAPSPAKQRAIRGDAHIAPWQLLPGGDLRTGSVSFVARGSF